MHSLPTIRGEGARIASQWIEEPRNGVEASGFTKITAASRFFRSWKVPLPSLLKVVETFRSFGAARFVSENYSAHARGSTALPKLLTPC